MVYMTTLGMGSSRAWRYTRNVGAPQALCRPRPALAQCSAAWNGTGATHLFEEAGALEQVAALARDWFIKYLPTTI